MCIRDRSGGDKPAAAPPLLIKQGSVVTVTFDSSDGGTLSFAVDDRDVTGARVENVFATLDASTLYPCVGLCPFVDPDEKKREAVSVDCDLYSSTRDALRPLAEAGLLQPGLVLHFDEFWGYPRWEEHEARAWAEVSEEFQLGYELLHWHGQRVAVRILHP